MNGIITQRDLDQVRYDLSQAIEELRRRFEVYRDRTDNTRAELIHLRERVAELEMAETVIGLADDGKHGA